MRRPFRSIALLPILSLLASACTLRYSQTTFKDPVLQSEKAGFSMQTGLVLFGRDHAFGRTDAQLLLNRQEFASQPKTVLQNVSLTARYFPVRSGFVRPFVGGLREVAAVDRPQHEPVARAAGAAHLHEPHVGPPLRLGGEDLDRLGREVGGGDRFDELARLR